MTPAEIHERFRQVVQRGFERAVREEAEHYARLRATSRPWPRRVPSPNPFPLNGRRPR